MSSTRSASAHAPSGSSSGHGSGSPYMNSPFRAYQLWQRAEYPKQVWYFVASGIALLIVSNIINLLRTRARVSSLRKSQPQPTSSGDVENNATNTPKVSSFKRITNSIDAAFKIVAFRWTVPYGFNYVLSLTELFFTLGYLGALLIWTFVHSHGADEGFWAQRAGALAFRQIPLLPLLAGKNNFITLVTNISYEKINIMHRSVARTLFILTLLHTFSKVDTFTPANLAQQKYTSGALAAVAFGAIFLSSVRPIRTHAFELFLILHICLISTFLAGLYYHQPKDVRFIWLFCGFWVFDRVVRGLRLLIVNRGQQESHEAIVETISRDSIKLVLPNRKITWKAGQHVFLILPGVSTVPFEAHPFTIANIPDRDANGRSKPTDLVFYIRAMDGFTRKLHDYAALHHGEKVMALADGPYGRPPPVNTFSTVVLVAGGSGASFTVPLLLDIIAAANSQKSLVKRVVFVWSVKDNGDLKWASDVLAVAAATAPTTLDLDLRVHVTRANGIVPSLNELTEEKAPVTPISPTSKEGFDTPKKESRTDVLAINEDRSSQGGSHSPIRSAFATHFGRPNIPEIIQKAIEESSGPVSINGIVLVPSTPSIILITILACGPGRLTRAVRGSLRGGAAGPSAASHGGVSVSMYIENFGAVRSGQS
ncbi:hypothetical protein CPB86DRAFT_507131 [Serendipita vermifera]|nr:hypothetical protein CPB86DRAFT_507131 [Serendipita vermifera]